MVKICQRRYDTWSKDDHRGGFEDYRYVINLNPDCDLNQDLTDTSQDWIQDWICFEELTQDETEVTVYKQ